ncbi:MAG: shikimate kinase [Candidatus Omnitrophota bacterium]|nr:shikimate kinase [Candidatus Omnitrophota bacterium]MDZ4242399.1 shikimate kinase [Candidatus Omnitrophota bacterium]
MKKNIVLIGFMGSGKSFTGKDLGKKLNRRVLSTDDLVEKKAGKSIAEIFRDEGEKHFRALEKEVVAGIVCEEGVVVDCGGGIVLDPENVAALKKNGVLIYLRTSPEWVYRRVKGQVKRPLLNVPDPQKKIAELLKEREPAYRQADHTVDTDAKTWEEVGDEIVALCKNLRLD